MQEFATNFLAKYFAQKVFFVEIFVGNEFYNFVGNNYPWRNCYPIKIHRKNRKKGLFSQNFITNFQKKPHKILKILVVNSNCIIGI